jgi:putative cardiolipin synthase
MHNKSFTVDNQIAIVGGRNIADECFGSRDDARFGDLDVACIDPVVDEVSSCFDSYRNHERAAPIPAFAKLPEDPEAEHVELRLAIDEGQERLSRATYEEVLQDRELGLLEEDGVTWVWAPYELILDSPDKSPAELDEDAASIKARLKQSVFAAESEAILLSPYFVPRKLGIEFLSELEARGVEVQVITNSLASNNQFAVHAGYAPARRELLESGVELYEMRPDAYLEGQDLVAASGARSTLHT